MLNNDIKQVFILAAGQGLRMRPLTLDNPKPLVKINGLSMLDRILQKVNLLNNIEKIVVNGFYLADKVANHLNNINDHRIIFSEETTKLETGGGLLQALKFFDINQPILIINGDIVWQSQDVLPLMIKEFKQTKCNILLGLKNKKDFLGYEGNGDFNLDKNNNISKSDNNNYVYTGIQIFHPRVLQNIAMPKPPFSLNHFFKDNHNIVLKGLELPGQFYHIGTIPDLEKYQYIIDDN